MSDSTLAEPMNTLLKKHKALIKSIDKVTDFHNVDLKLWLFY